MNAAPSKSSAKNASPAIDQSPLPAMKWKLKMSPIGSGVPCKLWDAPLTISVIVGSALVGDAQTTAIANIASRNCDRANSMRRVSPLAGSPLPTEAIHERCVSEDARLSNRDLLLKSRTYKYHCRPNVKLAEV